MPHEKSTLEEMISMLKQQRDEINLKIHLAGDEAKAEWKTLRDRLDKLTADYEPVKKAAGESAGNVYESLKLVAEEIRDGFNRVRKSL
jgi:uncharacterized coiled-coil DUF342 family protein